MLAAREMKTWAFWRALLAEFLGMVVFVFIGLSAAIGDKNNSYPDQEIKVALAFGLAIATLAQCLGHISGAHLNPAVTLGLLTSCQMSIFRAFFYILAQVLGAIAGSAIVYGIRPETTESLGVNKVKRCCWLWMTFTAQIWHLWVIQNQNSFNPRLFLKDTFIWNIRRPAVKCLCWSVQSFKNCRTVLFPESWLVKA